MKDKYSEDVANFKVANCGINRDRGCTDCLCLLFFWAFIGAMGYATIFGYQNGQVAKLTAPVDGGLNFCGFGEMEGYPKLMLTSFVLSSGSDILTSGVCVKECPLQTGAVLKEGVDCKSNKNVNCNARKTYHTYDAFDFCLPDQEQALTEEEHKGYDYLMTWLSESAVGIAFDDTYKSSSSIYIAMGLALVWSIAYIYLMSLYAETLAWVCIVLIKVGLLLGTIFMIFKAKNEKSRVDTLKGAQGYDSMDDFQKKEFDEKEGSRFVSYVVLTVFLALFFVLFVVGTCFAKESLQRAIDVIDASADYVAHNKRVITVPVMHYMLTAAVTVVWLGAFVCIISLNQFRADPIIPQGRDIIWDKKMFYLALFMFFGYLWIISWIDYTSRFIVIVGASTYYFNNNRENLNVEAAADIDYGFYTAYVNHMGSIAFGAFIMAVVKLIRIVFYYAAKKLQQLSGENPVSRAFVTCANCVLGVIEKICDYLNEAAFCYMAVTGEPFLTSAWEAFLLNLKHGLKFVFANLIAKVFIFIGKVGIVIGNCFCLYLLMKYRHDLDEVHSLWGPMLIVGIFSYIAASLFLSLFDQAIMALLTCLCFDLDANGGEPIYGPATFHDDYIQKQKNQIDQKKENEE